MNKKVTYMFLLVSLLIFCLSLTPAFCAKTTVRMWTFLNPKGVSPRDKALSKIIDNFERDNPGIKVAVEPTKYDILPTKFLAANMSGTAPDITWLSFYPPTIPEAIVQGALADLNELFINEWTEAEREDVSDIYWNYAVMDGKRYQITHSRSADILMYRKDLFEEAGVEAPIQTWDEFRSVAQKFTRDLDGDGIIDCWGFGQAFALTKGGNPIFIPILLGLQGKIFSEDGKPLWTTEAGVKAMEFQTDLIKRYKVGPIGCANYTIEDLFEGYAAGRYAIITAAAVRVPTVREKATFDPMSVQAMRFPGWIKEKPCLGYVSGWGMGVWSKSKVKKEAGKFVEYMMNKESERVWIFTAFQPPFRKSTARELHAFFEKPKNQFIEVMREVSAKYGWTSPTRFPVTGFAISLLRATQKILLEDMDTKVALQEAEKMFMEKR